MSRLFLNQKDIYDDVGALLKDLCSDIEDTLADEVLDEVKNIEMEHVRDDVFGVYTPSIYKRRAHGGIDDPENIVGTVKNMELEVDNVTEFNDDYGTYNHGEGLADLINEGEHSGGYFYDYPGEFTLERPFLDKTIEEVEETDKIDNALEKGLKNRGYDVK